MPFYEYQCSSCSHHVEVLQKISDAPLRKCPDCGKQALKRLMSAPVFRLKGGGWYETDFKSESEQKRNLAGREEGAEAKSDESATTDSAETAKVEAKADAKAGDGKSEASKPESATAKKTTVAKPVAKTPARPSAKPAKPAKRVARAATRKKAAARR